MKSTFLDISPQVYANLLKSTFNRLKQTVVIESLNSTLMPNPLLVLEVLLHGIGNVKFIMLILLSLNLFDYIDHQVTERYKKYLEDEAKNKQIRDGDATVKKTKTKGSEAMKNAEGATQIALIRKQVSKDISKLLESQFDRFSDFQDNALELAEFWDRRQGILIKPPAAVVKLDKKHKRRSSKANLSLNFTQTVTQSTENSRNIGKTIYNILLS
ncbi:uncharacterized protein LOC130447834 [Diorhabda sublineata]|uniref:uncharacterized protein LOC130447834 n=1 Tax=Diorhabda sublineata TaxID=1163346 RepID=UPI0024E069F7|nr:uncharacterized protein LOC130447834 [Diorhabda sublineata]